MDRPRRTVLDEMIYDLGMIVAGCKKAIDSNYIKPQDVKSFTALFEEYNSTLVAARKERQAIKKENIGALAPASKKKEKIKCPPLKADKEQKRRKEETHKVSGINSIRAKILQGGATGLKK